MTYLLKIMKLCYQLIGLSIFIGWFVLGFIMSSGTLPRSPQPLTHHTVPINEHGTIYYVTDFQDRFLRWAIPVLAGMSLLWWLVIYIRKQTRDENVA